VLYADFMSKPDKARPLVEQFLSDAPAKHPARAAAEKLKADLGATAKPEAAPAAGAKSSPPKPHPTAKPKKK
jgi:hypothetical protein